jgi:DNA invertase Pin-like site-specific DNA recombinase
MNYGYIRISTDKQTTENQRFEIIKFTKLKQFEIDEWIEETISSTKRLDIRKFGQLLHLMQKGDVLVVSELSRMGRNLMQIMKILHDCMEKDVMVYTVKEGYELGNNINSKVLAFAFGLSAEIERNLISQRTKEALARRKAEGQVLGRPKGSKSQTRKLSGRESEISSLLNKKISYSGIARILGVHRLTVSSFVKEKAI